MSALASISFEFLKKVQFVFHIRQNCEIYSKLQRHNETRPLLISRWAHPSPAPSTWLQITFFTSYEGGWRKTLRPQFWDLCVAYYTKLLWSEADCNVQWISDLAFLMLAQMERHFEIWSLDHVWHTPVYLDKEGEV